MDTQSAHASPPGFEALLQAIELCGKQSELARRLDVSPMTITQWKKRGVPVERCRELEQAVEGAIPRERFRPDHFRSKGDAA